MNAEKKVFQPYPSSSCGGGGVGHGMGVIHFPHILGGKEGGKLERRGP